MNELDKIKNLYQNLGILEVPLHKYCPHAKECWKNGESRYPKDRWAYISAPYIGSKYDIHKIMFLGKNLNEWGGFDALNICIEKERKKTNRNKTNIFLWAPILATIPLKLLGHLTVDNIEDDLKKISQDKINEIYEYISFDNMIKCSPVGERSEVVTDDMWDNCISYILIKSINILNPNIVLFLTKGSSSRLINNDNLEEYDTVFEDNNLIIRKSDHNSPRIIVDTYHPAYVPFDKKAKQILSDLEEQLSKHM
jgi:hypothetical protein